MVLEVRKRLLVTRCLCKVIFQGDNFKKHVANIKPTDVTHGREQRIVYCVSCNIWGELGENFSAHDKCPYVRLSKKDLEMVMERKEVPNRQGKVAAYLSEREEVKVKAQERARRQVKAKAVSARTELEAAIASITPPSQLTLSDSEEEEREDGEVEEQAVEAEDEGEPLAKRRGVDLDSTSDSSITEHNTSTPVKSQPPSFEPRTLAVHVSQTHARNQLVDTNNRLRTELAKSKQELALLTARKVDARRMNELARERGEALKRSEETLARERRERAEEKTKLEEERREREEEKKKLEAMVADLQRTAKTAMARVKEAEARLANLEGGRNAFGKVLFHLGCVNGRITKTFIQDNNPNESIRCFSDSGQNMHCHHITVKDYENIRVQNVRWPSECKLERFHFIDACIFSFSLHCSLSRQAAVPSPIQRTHQRPS